MIDAKRRKQLEESWAKEDAFIKEEVVKALIAIPGGRKYLWWLLQIGKVGQQPFTAQALTTSFACGELNVGQQIFAHILTVAPDGYVQMAKEMENDRLTRINALNDLADDGADDTGADED